MRSEKIRDIEKKLTDVKTKLEELFTRILLPVKEAHLRSKLKEDSAEESVGEESQHVVVHQHPIEAEIPDVKLFDEDDEDAIDFQSLHFSTATTSSPHEEVQ